MYNPSTFSLNDLYAGSTRNGKHKIFIGIAPGVGKTYKMLEEAKRLKKDGIDVVIGYLETHGRQETAVIAQGLEVIPRKQMGRGDLMLTEMDTDAIIARKPKLVLIDELAHINLIGSFRKKRHEDIEAILAAGIDVYSTLNIQHLESLAKEITEITGIIERELIPDSLLETAKEVVVVDVTPETLEERLLDGKIYTSSKIKPEIQQLFQRHRLAALRELALRQIADKIEQEALEEAARYNNCGREEFREVCTIQERILVCISTAPSSLQLVTRGAKLAEYMNAPLYVLFVNQDEKKLTEPEQGNIDSCKKACQDLGGDFLQVSGQRITEEIARVAKSHRITQLVFGQTRRTFWQTMIQGSLINQLVRLLTHIDIHIIGAEK